MKSSDYYKIKLNDLENLFSYFQSQDFLNIGPYLKDGAIMCGELNSFSEFPQGYYEELDRGQYRLIQKSDNSLFQYTLGPQSFKQFILPQRTKLWSADISNGDLKIEENKTQKKKKVFWGIRSCDLQSIATLDRIFLRGDYKNPVFENSRKDIFTVAVNCTQPSKNCFCTAMDTGPGLKKGYDLGLTEIRTAKEHYFICQAGSSNGREICNHLEFEIGTNKDIQIAKQIIDVAARSMLNDFDKKKARNILKEKIEHDHWLDVEKRCLDCANCTLVCPTCFCTKTEDITDLDGSHTERWLKWDSCFNGDFSYIHGGAIRKSIKSRYRQWISHKLSTWYDQFDMSGCVGCGRCITWCPVGIDLREEVKHLSDN